MSTTTAPAAAAAPTSSPWPVFWIASSAVFLVSLDTTLLYAAFPALRASFAGASAADLSWVLNAYTVIYAAMLVPAGALADRRGRKRIFMLGATLFLAASAACGLAGNVPALIAARVVQALGAALLTPASLSLVLAAFPASKRAVAISLWGAVSALAAAVGPCLGSIVVDSVGWPWAFYINLPVGAVALWFGAGVLSEARGNGHGRVDLVGMALLILAVGAIALSIVQSESPHWTRSELLVAAITGVLSLAGFIAWARKTPQPLVDLGLFRHRTFAMVNLATLAFGSAFAMMFFGFFFYMTGIWHYTLPEAGLAVTPGPLIVIPSAIVGGRLAARLGHRPVLVTGALIYALAGLWFMSMPGDSPDYLGRWLPGLILNGIGIGLVLPSLSAAAAHKLPPAQYAVGSAVNQATRQIGSVLGVAVTVLLLGHGTLSHTSFVPLYACHIGLALLTALLCLSVDTRPKQA
ncbi:DHA2 family efflux MFS transporter permease subunit [Pelomonas sp. SE-A7]|uniref:DHA2 family efflux MFS transporter permease subunit n=1 Tax=Pelomonas sp. SE-A7 TaxID=3054953 RepID=UPI00259D1B37|nr:DHA2 family efflux MFS transporter permease subunit [Pelomonas sp. SE-A7]MDM4765412.1 DHA2 family efflux MFS transporter permease subunit [Pelomonas sp. SE-A7]